MAGGIVVFGATGYTGRLVVGSLVRRGARPLLAGRDASRLAAVSAEVSAPGRAGALPVAVADARDAGSIAALLGPGDVLISTVGPFLRYGDGAVTAAIRACASYLDSTGEPGFLRRVFDVHGPAARDAGAGLLPAFGYDYAPGNLAAALALREAGDAATRVDVGYFVTGSTFAAASSGTRASAGGVLLEPGFRWSSGRLVPSRPGAAVRSFSVGGRSRSAVSISGSEHLALPRIAPALREVGVYLGWFGPMSRAVALSSAAAGALRRLPGLGSLTAAAGSLLSAGRGGGPSAAARAVTGSLVVAEAADDRGRRLARVVLRGPNAYTLTGDLLAAVATVVAAEPLPPGALGPVDGLGLDRLAGLCRSAGLLRAPD